MQRVRRKPVGARTAEELSQQLATSQKHLAGVPFLDGVLVENVEPNSSGVYKVQHRLGRPYRGFICLSGDNVVETRDNPEKSRELLVSSTAQASFIGEELISRYTFGSNSTSATLFSGLDGNTDVVWTYRFFIIGNSNTTTWLYWNPNGSTANGMGTWHYANAAATLHGSAGAGTEMALMRSDGYLASSYNICGDGIFFAATSFGRRQSLCRANDFNSNTSSGYYGGAGSGTWHNTADNITSLGITAATASFIGTGSWFELYRKSNIPAVSQVTRPLSFWVF